MYLLNVRFVIRALGVAEKYVRFLLPVWSLFRDVNVRKFTAVIGQKDRDIVAKRSARTQQSVFQRKNGSRNESCQFIRQYNCLP